MSKISRSHKSGKPVCPAKQQANQQINTPLNSPQSRPIPIVVAVVILISIVVAFWGIWQNDFINYDDDDYITANTQVKKGLTCNGIVWAFTTTHGSNWHPLTWLSHMADCQLFALKPAGHHLAGLLLHAANSLLLFLALIKATKNLWKSAFVAALFALHPLHVESVAWVAERKDLLSTFFWLLTIIFYVRYVRRRKIDGYILAFLAFVFGLMAKPMLVTLPFVFLIFDYWPLRRFEAAVGRRSRIKALIFLFKEKIPFFVLAVVSCIITVYAQQTGGAIKGIDMLAMKFRIGNAVVCYISYIVKMLAPVNLAVFYPHPGDALSLNKVTGAAALLICITLIVFINSKRRPWLIAGWLWYVGTLVPVIGIVQVGAQAMADRYTYIPLIGLFVIIAWQLPDFFAEWRYKKIVLGVSAVLVLLILSMFTRRQVRHWQNSFTLFEHALDVTDNNYRAHFILAKTFANAGQSGKAVEHYMAAIQIKPGHADAHHNLGAEAFKQGKIGDAITHYKNALYLQSDRAETYNNLGVALEVQRRFDEAVKCYSQAIKLKPDYVKAHYNLANALRLQGKRDDAVTQYRKVLQLYPNHTRARHDLQQLLENTP